ncbi:hypothetical protein BN174_4430002 [Clostridioides difficile E15]|nr:hypothetical protein BN174_4430002 [Clostridioides difficile E15]
MYVKEQTEEICLEATKNDKRAFQYVKEQTVEVCIEAIKGDLVNLSFIKDDMLNELNKKENLKKLKLKNKIEKKIFKNSNGHEEINAFKLDHIWYLVFECDEIIKVEDFYKMLVNDENIFKYYILSSRKDEYLNFLKYLENK